MSRSRRTAFAAGLALAGSALALPAAAQDLTYTTTTKMEMSGTLGRILSMLTDMDKPQVEKTSFQGSRVRKDQEKTSSIMDWSAGAMTFLDHPELTFMRFDFTQMAEAPGESPSQREAGEGPEVEVTVTTDRTGKSETIAGYAAEQVILTVEMKPKDAAEAEETAQGGMALVTELWLSTAFPEYVMMQQMEGAALEQFRKSGGPQGVAEAMGALAGSDPRMQEGWEKNMEAMKELQGTALRSTTHFVSLPPGATLDRDKVLESSGQAVSEGGGVGQSAANVARQALGGLAGRLGRGRPQEEAAPAAPPAQAVIMRVKTEIGDVSTGAVDASVFLVPEGYTERTPPVR
ncbi:MAG: hypothetical protein Q8N53_10520 [Longimicrobiales bacterium]|nr:hypothetical protein [Longimicrobiales bacterium]